MKLDRAIAIILSLFFFYSMDISAQSKNAIVLIDGKPTEVRVNEQGKIEYIIQEVPKHIPNYKKSKQNHFVSERNATGKYLNRVSNVIYFLPGKATLSDATIGKLNEIANTAISNNARVLLKTQYNDADQTSKILANNRIDACKSYLKIKGVNSGMIAIAKEKSQKASAKIEVFVK